LSELKPGSIAHIKTTDEPVFILDIKPISGPHALAGCLSGVEAMVRRPTLDEHGKVDHRVDRFFVEELETKEDASIRKVREMESLKAQFDAERTSKTANILGSAN
jgi:hypothetical protein